MSLSKTSGKHTIATGSKAVRVGGTLKVETGRDHLYSVAANIPYNSKLRNPATKVKSFSEPNLIVLTVNPKLDKAASTEKLNAKAESAKQMFANYRNKK
jgi:hypothetical protein